MNKKTGPNEQDGALDATLEFKQGFSTSRNSTTPTLELIDFIKHTYSQISQHFWIQNFAIPPKCGLLPSHNKLNYSMLCVQNPPEYVAASELVIRFTENSLFGLSFTAEAADNKCTSEQLNAEVFYLILYCETLKCCGMPEIDTELELGFDLQFLFNELFENFTLFLNKKNFDYLELLSQLSSRIDSNIWKEYCQYSPLNDGPILVNELSSTARKVLEKQYSNEFELNKIVIELINRSFYQYHTETTATFEYRQNTDFNALSIALYFSISDLFFKQIELQNLIPNTHELYTKLAHLSPKNTVSMPNSGKKELSSNQPQQAKKPEFDADTALGQQENLRLTFEGVVNRKFVAGALREVREQQDLTERQAAEIAGVSQNLIWRIETQKSTVDKGLEVLEKLGCKIRGEMFCEFIPPSAD